MALALRSQAAASTRQPLPYNSHCRPGSREKCLANTSTVPLTEFKGWGRFGGSHRMEHMVVGTIAKR